MKKFFNNLHPLLSWGRIGRVAPVRWLPVFFLGLLLLTGCQATVASPGEAYVPIPEGSVGVYFFWGEGCPHCAEAKPFLESLALREPRVVLRSYEIWYNDSNREILQAMAKPIGFDPKYVPTIFVGSRYWEGYSEEIGREIEAAVASCLQSACPDPAERVFGTQSAATAVPTQQTVQAAESTSKQIRLPLIGAVDLSTQSLTVSTALIALVDGFNPCSVWVLTILLALTLHTGSRRKVLLIGLIFLSVTAAIYALFITGLFTVFSVLSFTGWIQAVVALVALVFGLVNLKDYFWYKEGVSFSISESKKPGLFQRMRNLMDPNLSFWGLAGGTVVLAAGVSLIEFSCTAGFPVLWTNLLTSQGVGTMSFLLLLLLYLVIYQADEMVIFGAAVYSLRSSRLEEKHGRILKLIGGMLMLTLAGVMLIKPSLMNDLGTSLIIFGVALLAVLLVLALHRSILPAMGIQIGSEFSKKRQRHSSSKKRRRRRKR